MILGLDLTTVWALILAFAVLMYVVMDGFDLGIGILFPFYRPGDERDQAMNAIAPVWDGNETWLVLGGGGLLAAFPLAYAIILPATYPLIMAMLLGLVFRGVAFEFRWRDPAHRAFWDLGFTGGSLVAALSQGIILGALLQGVHVEGRAYAGGWLDWLSPYSLLTGLGVVCGYALLGACWTAGKIEGSGAERAFGHARLAAFATFAAMAAVSLATPFLAAPYYQRWFAMPTLLYLSPVPVVTGLAALFLLRGLAQRRSGQAFALALLLFLLGMIGLGVSMWPHVVPPSITIWQAAAPPRAQEFMLVGVALIMPLILGYTGWTYWVFRGKVGSHGFH